MKKLFAALAVAALVLVSCNTAPETIKIGTINPLSGGLATYGQQVLNAIKLVVADVNAKGGIDGKMIELVSEDDEGKPELTSNAFQKLVNQDKVVAIIGALTSNCSLAIAAQAQAEGIPMISPTSTNATVTNAGDFVFRACYIDPFQGRVVANFAVDTLMAKSAAVLYDVANDYSKGLYDNFRAVMEAKGLTVSAESYAAGDKDFNAQITKLRAARPDVLFIPDYYNTVSLIAKQVRAQGLTIPMLGADGWDEITNNAGDEVLNSFYSNHYSTEAQDPEVQNFIAAYKAAYNNETPNALAALGYDAAQILFTAIDAAGSLEGPAIRDAMAQVNGKFVTGSISFDANRNPVKSAVMLEVVKNAEGVLATRYAGTVNP